jgi:hypothetical protein
VWPDMFLDQRPNCSKITQSPLNGLCLKLLTGSLHLKKVWKFFHKWRNLHSVCLPTLFQIKLKLCEELPFELWSSENVSSLKKFENFWNIFYDTFGFPAILKCMPKIFFIVSNFDRHLRSLQLGKFGRKVETLKWAHTLVRVARWFVLKPKILIWVNFRGSCNWRCW